MKKLLLLGGSAQQVVAIEKAKKLNYYTVLCDYLTDNPGQYVADKFYLVSTTDKEAILEVAKKENIDGIIAYASDPAAPTAAFVAEQLNLPGNPYKSVEILCNKDKFRQFLSDNGFNTPKAKGYSSVEDAFNDIKNDYFKFPIIVKPVDSSGSKGATVLYSKKGLKKSIDFAFSFSRNKRIVVEEFIEKKHPYLIGGDILIADGNIVLWGMLNCHRDPKVNPLVPVGKSYPLELSGSDLNQVKNYLKGLVASLNIKFGAMNVELVVDKNNKVFPIDIGPRSGGNMIPDLLGDIFDIDIIDFLIRGAIGENPKISPKKSNCFYATYNLHSLKSGKYKDIEFSNLIEKNIYKKCLYKDKGDYIEFFDNASKALGMVFMKFDTKDEMNSIMSNIDKNIKVNFMG